MRRLILIATTVLVTGAAGAAGWHYLRPHDKLAEARQLLAHGDLRGAQLLLRSAVLEDPNRANVHLQLAKVQLALGDPIAAEKEFRTARAQGAEAEIVTPLLAHAVLAQHRDDEVLRDFLPDGLPPAAAASVLVARAEAQMALKRPDPAAASLAQAQALVPQSEEVALAGVRLALQRGDAATAEARADAALKIEPRSQDALMLQAALRTGRGDRAAALDSYNTAIADAEASAAGTGAEKGASGNLGSLRLARAGLLVAMNDPRARADVDAVLAAQPKNRLANYLAAELYARDANWKAADAALSAVGPVLAQLPRSDVLVAVVKFNMGEPEQAIEAAAHQVARAPGDLAALKLLARLHLAQHRPDRAAEVLTAATAAGHSDTETLTLLSGIDARSGKPEQALAAIRQASALAPDDTWLLTRLAALQVWEGQPQQATQTLQRALDRSPPAPAAPTQAAPAPAALTPAALTPAQDAAVPDRPTPQPPAYPGAQAPTQAQTAAALVAVALRAGDIDQATAALDRLRQANGAPMQVALLEGLVRLAQIDLPGARAAFETARRIDPASLPARLDLARVLELQGHAEAAAALLGEALAADPTNAIVVSALVNLRLAAQQPDRAVAAAEAAHAAKPDDPGFVNGLADLYTRIGQPEKALALLDSAAQPGAPAAAAPPTLIATRLRAELALGQRPAAAASLRALLDRRPEDTGLRAQLVQLLAADKQYDSARSVLTDGLARHPGDPALLAAGISVASLENGPQAGAAYSAKLAADPANGPAAARLQADLLMSQQQYGAAARLFRAQRVALPSTSADAEPLLLREAQAVASGGDPDHAATLLRDWLAAHPASVATALTLSGFDIAAHRWPEAGTQLRAVLALQPNNPQALNNLAWVSQMQGEFARARSLATRAYLLSPTPEVADTLAWVLLGKADQADPAAALGLLREAAAARPGNPQIQYHLAAALTRDGDKTTARRVLQTLLTPPSGQAASFDDKPAAQQLLRDLTL